MLTSELLSQIVSKLESYHTAYCSLKHEQVVSTSYFENTTTFKRYGFCDQATRKQRIGCAHTSANGAFYKIMLSAGTQVPDAKAWADKVEQLFLEIYLIDFVKGALEKQLALARSANDPLMITEAKMAITEVISTHHQLIKAIEELKFQFINKLKNILSTFIEA